MAATDDQRRAALKLLQTGVSRTETARLLDLHRNTVARWAREATGRTEAQAPAIDEPRVVIGGIPVGPNDDPDELIRGSIPEIPKVQAFPDAEDSLPRLADLMYGDEVPAASGPPQVASSRRWTKEAREARARHLEAFGLDPDDDSGYDENGSRVLRSNGAELGRRRLAAEASPLGHDVDGYWDAALRTADRAARAAAERQARES